jgi:hypothetical protein
VIRQRQTAERAEVARTATGGALALRCAAEKGMSLPPQHRRRRSTVAGHVMVHRRSSTNTADRLLVQDRSGQRQSPERSGTVRWPKQHASCTIDIAGVRQVCRQSHAQSCAEAVRSVRTWRSLARRLPHGQSRRLHRSIAVVVIQQHACPPSGSSDSHTLLAYSQEGGGAATFCAGRGVRLLAPCWLAALPRHFSAADFRRMCQAPTIASPSESPPALPEIKLPTCVVVPYICHARGIPLAHASPRLWTGFAATHTQEQQAVEARTRHVLPSFGAQAPIRRTGSRHRSGAHSAARVREHGRGYAARAGRLRGSASGSVGQHAHPAGPAQTGPTQQGRRHAADRPSVSRGRLLRPPWEVE